MSQIRIPLPKRFSFQECLWFLDRNYDECLHLIDGHSLVKAIRVGDQPVVFRVWEESEELVIGYEGQQELADSIQAYVVDWLDMDRDLEPFYLLLSGHEKLSYLSEAFSGLRLIAIPDLFEALCWSIIGQQINLTFAYRLKRRLVETYGERVESKQGELWLFPSPETLAGLEMESLKELQFSRQKAQYLILTAQAFANGEISKTSIAALPTLSEKLQQLMSLKGIGEWTANYALMKSLKELSCVPYGDAGLIKALLEHQLIADRKDRTSTEALFSKVKGWESYLVIYLWRSLAVPEYKKTS